VPPLQAAETRNKHTKRKNATMIFALSFLSQSVLLNACFTSYILVQIFGGICLRPNSLRLMVEGRQM